MPVRLEEDRPSIVIAGAFDPRFMHPQWFRAEGLLGKAEAETADVKVVIPAVAEWSTKQLLVQVTQSRFLVQGAVTSDAEQVRDLVLGVLKVLDKVPATALGVNRSMHFDVGGEGNWHRVGDAFAPKQLWTTQLGKPGLLSLQMEDAERRDGLPGRGVVTVQPSTKFPRAVYFDVNNEIRTASKTEEPVGAAFSSIIEAHWRRLHDDSLVMAEAMLEEVIR